MLMSGITRCPRFANSQEFSLAMSLPVCKLIRRPADLRPGDIGAIRTRSFFDWAAESHGFIYLSPVLAFSKNGYRKERPFEFLPVNDVLKHYGADPANEACAHSASTAPAGCKTWVNYYRCDSISAWVGEGLEGVPRAEAALFSAIEDDLSERECAAYRDAFEIVSASEDVVASPAVLDAIAAKNCDRFYVIKNPTPSELKLRQLWKWLHERK